MNKIVRDRMPFWLLCTMLILGSVMVTHSYAQECFEPNATKYQGGWHHNIMIRGDNTVVVWGSPTGMGTRYVPTLVPNLEGIPVEVGAATTADFQLIRTTEKIYFYGGSDIWTTGAAVPGTTTFRDITSQLPAGVGVSDIKRMVLSRYNVALITKGGDLYIRNIAHFASYGAGLTSNPPRKQWQKALISNVETFQAAGDAAIALTTNNQVYIWGASIKPGDGNINVTLTVPTLVPSQFYGNEKALMIGCAAGLNFYILTEQGYVWSWGNTGVSLGRGGTAHSVPMQILNPMGTAPLENIMKIDAANEAGISCIGMLDGDNQAYNLGANGFCMLQGCSTYTLPWKVIGPPFRDFVHGGHFTVGFRLNSCGPSGQYCYCGHRTSGSIGDGGTGDGSVSTYLCINSITNFECLIAAYDYGDAPASYHQNGPAGGMNKTLRLGTQCRFNTGPLPVAAGADNNGENGDGLEEDGLLSAFPVVQEGDTPLIDLSVRVINQMNCNAYLYAWVDWNRDGKFSANEAAAEKLVPHSPFPYTDYTLSFQAPGPIPSGGRTYMRFFLSKRQLLDDAGTGELDERSVAVSPDGEVEDYSFLIRFLPTELPVLSLQPQGSNNCFGTAVTLTVGATEESGSVTYQWKKNGTNIPGATNATLEINPVTAEDSGSYTCVVTNVVGSTESDPALLFAFGNAEFNN